MFAKKTIKDIDVSNKTVLVRCDFNVPLTTNGAIADDYRIRQTLPTIEYLRSQGAKIVLLSHMGRPDGKKDMALSLMPVATKISDLLHLPVKFVSDCNSNSAKQNVKNMRSGDIALLENLRFKSQEEANDEDFAKDLASMGDIFVQDGFGVVYRKHASTDAITHYLPSVAGLLLEKEVLTIAGAIEDPARPLMVIIGGDKTDTKLKLIDQLIDKADFVAVVGSLANIFLEAEDIEVGKSKANKNDISLAKEILKKARHRTKNDSFTFYLPHDGVVAVSKDTVCPTRVVDFAVHTWADIISYPKKPIEKVFTVQSNEWILDIGPMSAMNIAGAIKLAKTVVWNGPAGMAEVKGLSGAQKPFAHGSKIIAESLLGEHAGDKNIPFSIVGGGDTVEFVGSIDGAKERINHLSTGGGASIELMSGNSLPGISALMDKES